MLKTLILVSIIATAWASAEDRRCDDPNAEWTDCGTACPPTCQIRNPGICILLCIKGCACKPGFILAYKGGPCIANDTCKGHCRKDEEFNACGTKCPATCDDSTPSCEKICSDGCFCKPPMVLNNAEEQICVPKDKCTKKCGKNKVPGCWNPCPATCQVPKPTPCPTLVCQPGCVCAPGTVLENINSTRCVPIKKCKRLCGPNECYESCGTACPSTCTDRNRPCTLQCQPGCFCKDDYILSSQQGVCIKESSCTEKCESAP